MMNQKSVEDISQLHNSPISIIDHAIASLENLLSLKRFQVKHGSKLYFELRRDMIYVVHPTNISGTHILLNRNYKPAGSNETTGGTSAIYEDYTSHHVSIKSGDIEKMSGKKDVGYLFADGGNPWTNRQEANIHISKLIVLKDLIMKSMVK